MGPSAEEEAAFLAQERENTPVALPAKADEPEATGDLPPMDDLIKRIPAPARAVIDELFRARFVTVKRMPKAALKP